MSAAERVAAEAAGRARSAFATSALEDLWYGLNMGARDPAQIGEAIGAAVQTTLRHPDRLLKGAAGLVRACPQTDVKVSGMEHRHLGRSGLKVSEIAYGNWITHGSQVEEDAAKACVAAALDVGITSFDTADVYAGTKAEAVLGRALHGVRRESVEIFTKVFWPTGPGVNDRGLSRKHIMESAHASLRRLQTDYIDLYQAHRFDHETPLEETLRAFDDLVRQGKVLYIGVSEWRAEEIAAALKIAAEMGLDRIVSSQPS